MENVKKIYQEAFQKHGNSLNSIFIPKGRQAERFNSLTKFCSKSEKATLLDFGCGLGHLSGFLEQNYPLISYDGCDIVDELVTQSKTNFPENNFYKIDKYADVTKSYDYILAAGVFNLLYSESREEHINIVHETIKHLYRKTNKILSVNFMTDDVDFVAEKAYHQNPLEVYNFSRKNLTKRIVLDESYMPYEFTIHLFKNSEILRPDNIYVEV